MMVVLIIAILTGIAIPVYLSIQDKASRTVAKANCRMGAAAAERVFLDNLDKGWPEGYVRNAAGDPINAAYLRSLEPKVKWVDMPLTLNVDSDGNVDWSGWPEFGTLTPE